MKKSPAITEAPFASMEKVIFPHGVFAAKFRPVKPATAGPVRGCPFLEAVKNLASGQDQITHFRKSNLIIGPAEPTRGGTWRDEVILLRIKFFASFRRCRLADLVSAFR